MSNEHEIEALRFQLLAASCYIDSLGGDSRSYRAALAQPATSATAAQQEIVRHVKTGGLYNVLHSGLLEATQEPVIVYQSLAGGRVWVRPATEFNDGRFVSAPFADSAA